MNAFNKMIKDVTEMNDKMNKEIIKVCKNVSIHLLNVNQ